MKALTKNELQKLANNIITTENNLYNVDISLFALTKEELSNKKEHCIKVNADFPFRFIDNSNYYNFPAVYSKYGNRMFVFMGVENYARIFPIFLKKQKYKFIASLYHEIRHGLQDANVNNSNYMNLIFKIENIINYFNFSYYVENKNKFLLEIDADLYAYSKLLNFVVKEKNVNKDVLCDIKENINKLKMRSKQYEFDFIFRGLVDLVAKYPLLAKDEFLSIFFDSKGNLKNIFSIINNEKFKKLDYLFKVDVIYYFKKNINDIKNEIILFTNMDENIQLERGDNHIKKINIIKVLAKT